MKTFFRNDKELLLEAILLLCFLMKSLRLQEVMQTIQTYFDRQFAGKQFWCQAEVMQIKQHKQRVYIDLVEYDASGTLLAKMKALVWEIELL